MGKWIVDKIRNVYIRGMKNAYLLLFLLLVFKTAFCQIPIGYTQKTTHVNIPGTKVWLIPPANFELTDRYKGFYNKVDPFSSIMLTELPAAYDKFIGAFLKTGPTANNMNIVGVENCQLTGTTGCALVTVTQSAQGLSLGKYMLLFGDDKSSIMITATYLKDSVKIGEKLKNSIRTVYYNTQQVVNVRESIGFTFDETGSIFKFANVMGTVISFSTTPGANEKTDKIDFFAAKSFTDIEFQDKKAFCIKRIKENPYQTIEIDTKKGITEIEIDGIKGYELYAIASGKKGDPSSDIIYQIVLFDNTTYYILAAIFKQPSDKNIAAIKLLAKSFKRKTK